MATNYLKLKDIDSYDPEMIYSNYPEQILSSTGDHYTTAADIESYEYYTVFFYHHNYAGTKKIGVAIKNTGSSNLTVTYRGGGMLSGGSTLDNCGTLALYCVNGNNGTSLRSVTNLAPGKSAFMVYNDTTGSSSAPTPSVGKFRFKTDESAQVRVFHMPTNYSAADAFSLSQDGASPDSQDDSRVSASGVDKRKHIEDEIDCSENPTFKLFEYDLTSYNKGEYQYYREWNYWNPNCSRKLWGNYEQEYKIDFINSDDKTLILTPVAYPARIITKEYRADWALQPKITSGSYSIPLGSRSNCSVRIILLGGNSGNFTGQIQ